MDLYLAKAESSGRAIAADDMFLTKSLPTTAGSKMLEGYMSLLESEALTRLTEKGFNLVGKTAVGEFAIDLIGESCHYGSCEEDGALVYAPVAAAMNDDIYGALCLDVNGAPARGAAHLGATYLKPTYGTVSRYGIIGVASSGETVGITAKSSAAVKELLTVIAGHDDKDGTSLSDELCARVNTDAKPAKIAVLTNFAEKADIEVNAKIGEAVKALKSNGIEVVEINCELLEKARIAWNILMSAEACNNVSRFDGVKYGYRSQNYTNIDELYTNSRSEAFGDLIKTCILFGSETLSTENYMPLYDKSLRVRRVISEKFANLFEEFDALILPACSRMKYTKPELTSNPTLCYEENLFTAPASITGLPALVCNGIQLIANVFDEGKLLSVAAILEKEGK